MTALQRVRAALAAGERPSDDDVREVCAMVEASAGVVDTLRTIRDADTRKWDLEVRDQFQQWAQNRARHELKRFDAALREPK